ncbi:MAG: NAD(P)H-dependent oxidoreductase [Proteobacteria bacterium]|nr:NAD(P)H-dependent oxidoreductase [Pseudomonadota bacterium]
MPKALISYYSKSGNTKKMAEYIKEGISSVEKMEVAVKKISETALEDMLNSDVIIIGSPTYFGVMTAEVKELMDKSIKYYGKLNGKIGGAFTSSGAIGGGNETTILSILQGLLIHGMIVQGVQKGNHYGPVSIGAPDESVKEECPRYGKLLGQLAVKTLK